MKQFQLKTQVHTFETCAAFLEQFPFTKDDLIFASKTIYNAHFKSFNVPCPVLFHSDYGKGEPTDQMIDRIFEDLKDLSFNRIIAIGGGSVIDIAKLFVIKDAKNTISLFEQSIPLIKEKELIAIPTTCGSGSEVSNISIAEITSKGTKLGLAVDPLYPDYAILISSLLQDLPFPFFAASSIDALIHAAESYVSPKSNPYTENFSVPAMEMIIRCFHDLALHGPEYRYRCLDSFMMASNYAGIAFSNTGTGSVHALSYPLSGVYHVTHGEANYQLFLEVFKTYERLQPNGKIASFKALCAKCLQCSQDDAFTQLEKILDQLLPHHALHEYGMKEEEIITFSDSVIASQQRLLSNAYTPLSREDILQIYKARY